jgi:hypothetical protein
MRQICVRSASTCPPPMAAPISAHPVSRWRTRRPPPARSCPSLPPFQPPPPAPVPIPATMVSRPILGSTSPCRAAFIVTPPSLIGSVAAKPLELPPGYLVRCRVPCGQKAKSPRKMKAVSVYTVGLSTYSGSCSFFTHRFETYHNYELETQILIFFSIFYVSKSIRLAIEVNSHR